MTEQFFTYRGATLHFLKSGNGSKTLFAFHGFGQNHRAFDEVIEQLYDRYTVYSFDIFFHGKSNWNKGEEPLEKSYWKDLMTVFLNQNKIDQLSLLGFSMGGKFVLATLEAFPKKVDSVFLLAPDGIKKSMWYRLATYPVVLRQLFKRTVLKPNPFRQVSHLAYKTGLIDKGMLRFVELQMNTETKRKQVYLSWVVLRHLKFDMNKIAEIINSNNIAFTLVVGQYDKIITVRDMNRLLKKIKDYTLITPETGHTGILSKGVIL